MPIHLITGTPGAGKTVFALEALLIEAGVKDRSSLKVVRAQLHEEHADTKITRPVVVCGVEGLKPDLFMEMDDPLEWEQYEDGTLFLVDEAWKWFGVQCKDTAKDRRFLALAEHRHRGMDFILTAQMPVQLLQHLRGLVSPHTHITRKFGTKTTIRYEWPSVQSNPNSQASKSISQERLWVNPSGVWEIFQSATLHTIKRKIPLKVLMIPVVALGVAGLLAAAGVAAKRFTSGDAVPEGETASAKASIPATVVTADDYARVREPRIMAVPASAPIYDGREVTSFPRLFCMSAGLDGRDGCRCVTEQNTRVTVDDAVCRVVARWGGDYDQYREVRAERQSNERDGDRGAGRSSAETAGNAGAPLVSGAGGAAGVPARYGAMRGQATPADAVASSGEEP
jgi:hypothetical protein